MKQGDIVARLSLNPRSKSFPVIFCGLTDDPRIAKVRSIYQKDVKKVSTISVSYLTTLDEAVNMADVCGNCFHPIDVQGAFGCKCANKLPVAAKELIIKYERESCTN